MLFKSVCYNHVSATLFFNYLQMSVFILGNFLEISNSIFSFNFSLLKDISCQLTHQVYSPVSCVHFINLNLTMRLFRTTRIGDYYQDNFF